MKMVLRWTTVHKVGPIHIGSFSLEIHCVNLVQASSHMSMFPMHYELLNFYPTIFRLSHWTTHTITIVSYIAYVFY